MVKLVIISLILSAVLVCGPVRVQAGVVAQLVNLCSNIEVRALASNVNDWPDLHHQNVKRSALWFGPRMGKRDPNGDAMEEQKMNNDQEEMLLGNIQGLLKRELEEKLGPDSQFVVYLVNETPNKYMTPRMGRELSERCLELQMVRPPMNPRLGRKV